MATAHPTIDSRLAFLARASAWHTLIEAGAADLEPAIESLTPAFFDFAVCECDREILNEWEREDQEILRRKQTTSTCGANKMSFDNKNRGALFRSKRTNENAAEYSGRLNIDGADYWLDGWVKTSSKGEKYFSLSVKPVTNAKSAKPVSFGESL